MYDIKNDLSRDTHTKSEMDFYNGGFRRLLYANTWAIDWQHHRVCTCAKGYSTQTENYYWIKKASKARIMFERSEYPRHRLIETWHGVEFDIWPLSDIGHTDVKWYATIV